MASAPKDRQLLVKGGEYEFSGETYPEWYPHKGVALVQWNEMDEAWKGEEFEGGTFYYRPTHYITVADLLASTPPPSPNELLEAAKEAAIAMSAHVPSPVAVQHASVEWKRTYEAYHKLRAAIRNAEQTGAGEQ